MVPPGFSSPLASAASTICRAIRSFTEPPGLRYSTLARTVADRPRVTEVSWTRGVSPTSSEMCWAYFIADGHLRWGWSTAAGGRHVRGYGRWDAAVPAGHDEGGPRDPDHPPSECCPAS